MNRLPRFLPQFAIAVLVLFGCADDDRATEPEPQVAARLIVTEEGTVPP